MNTPSYFLGCSVGLMFVSISQKSESVWFWVLVTALGFAWSLWDATNKEKRLERLTREVMLNTPELWRRANMLCLHHEQCNSKAVVDEIENIGALLKKIAK